MAKGLVSGVFKLAVFVLAAAGIVTIILAGMIAQPLAKLPPLASISDTVRAGGREDVPPVRYFQSRDGSQLAYRYYVATAPSAGRTAILVHGSSASSIAVHPLARALAAKGVESFVPDIRGHGASGTRGDIGYLGQLEDDMADLVALIRRTTPTAPLMLVGHSLGAGFALRLAGSNMQGLFARTVLLAPYLGRNAAATRENAGGWASANVPRILAISVLRGFGIACCDSLAVIAYAVDPGSARFLTAEYSYRLLMNFSAHRDYRVDLDAARAPVTLIAGAKDELMDAGKYTEAAQHTPARIDVKILDNVNHMDVVSTAAVVAVISEDIATR